MHQLYSKLPSAADIVYWCGASYLQLFQNRQGWLFIGKHNSLKVIS